MRFLKNKIACAFQTKQNQISPEEDQISADTVTDSSSEKHKASPKASSASTKTIVKNYGKAIASFAMDKKAKPYLSPLLKMERVKLKDFVSFSSMVKERVEGIQSFRAFLLINSTDNEKEVSCKKVFKGIAEVFIKFFSPNWIYSGRMTNKDAHLKYRFKMLRRIRNPEFFTYLK